MPLSVVQPAPRGFGQTARRDTWWAQPLVVFLVLGGFVVYSTWAALQGAYYRWGPYLSPFYSPELFGDPEHSWFGGKPGWWPGWIPFSAAMFILWVPAGFRLTCYYYRGAYYKSFWADPPACTVGEPRKRYWGESAFPLILQNLHRYFLLLAVIFVFLLAHDAWKALWFTDPASPGSLTSLAAETRQTRFGIGLGTLILAANAILLGGYTLGCHSLRHFVGGARDEISRNKLQLKCYDCVSGLNRRHMLWAWLSLFWVAFTDIYVRMCAMGIWTDWRIL